MKNEYKSLMFVLFFAVLSFIIVASTDNKLNSVIFIAYLLAVYLVGRVLEIKKSYKVSLIFAINVLFVLYLFILLIK